MSTPGERSAYSRCSIVLNEYYGFAKSPILSPAFSSIWLSAYIRQQWGFIGKGVLGFTKSGTNARLMIGWGSTNSKIGIYTYNGSSEVRIAEETGTSFGFSNLNRIDLNIVNYGESGQVIVYVNGSLVIDYSGNISVLSQSTLDQVIMEQTQSTVTLISEVIVADENTRLMSLKTLAPSSDGDTSANWTGAYTDIDEVTLSDSDKIYSSTADADFQANLTGMPTGTFSVKAVKVAARCVDGSGSKGIALGIKSGGTVNVGDTETCAGYWQTKERLMTVNPVTGVSFTPEDIEALQVNLRAKAL